MTSREINRELEKIVDLKFSSDTGDFTRKEDDAGDMLSLWFGNVG